MMDKNIRTKAKITEYIALRSTSIKAISKHTGIPASTIYGWLRDIDLAPIGKVRAIYDYLRVPDDERIGL